MTTPELRLGIVLDASVGIPLVWDDPASSRVARRVNELRETGHRLLVPSVFWLEIVNVLGRRYHAPPEAILEALVELEAAGLETVELERPMLLLAIDAIVRHGLTAYDAAYLALADAADARILNADATLAAAAGSRGILVSEDRGVRERPPGHKRPGPPAWAAWPGAAAYLRELRTRALEVSAGSGASTTR